MLLTLKTLVFILFVPGTVAILLPYFLLSTFNPSFTFETDQIQYIGLLPLLFGAIICLWCFWDFISFGEGTPAPIDPPKKLVVDGLYRFVSNPMYIGIILIIFGEAVLFSSLLLLAYMLVVFLIFHLFVIGYEEPALKSTFGESYEKYRASVPRWLIRLK